MLTARIQTHLSELKKQGLYRCRRVIANEDLNFSNNDYLSLSSEPKIQAIWQKAFARYPSGSGGSMMVCGYHPAHQTLEQSIARALGVDNALLFSSGYAANLGVMHLLASCQAQALIDKQVHASIYDGLKQSGVPFVRYLHNHVDDLAIKVQSAPENTVVITESIFSMSGQQADLTAIADVAHIRKLACIVDEAHAFGVVGKEGLGAVVQHQLTQHQVPLRVIPLGKACAASGAIVAGSGIWVDALLQSARSMIYSTAISPAAAYALLDTFHFLRQADARRAKLYQLIQCFREHVTQSPLTWRTSHSPIQQLQLGCPHRALSYEQALRAQGIVCFPMRQPTVSRQETGLRVILNYQHEPHDIQRLFSCLHDHLYSSTR